MAPNHWPPKGWEALFEDADCLYARDLGHGRIHFIRVDDMLDACGNDWEGPYEYELALSEADLKIVGDKALEDGRTSHEMDEEEWAKVDDVWKAETCHSAGQVAPLARDKAKKGYQAAVRRLAKISADIEENPAVHECYMNARVNALGSTAREYMQGDIHAALDRMGARPEGNCGPPKDATVDPSPFPPGGTMLSRRVRMDKINPGECMPVQIWGLGYCQTCEFRGTPKCGGKEIRRTGETANGRRVPVMNQEA